MDDPRESDTFQKSGSSPIRWKFVSVFFYFEAVSFILQCCFGCWVVGFVVVVW